MAWLCLGLVLVALFISALLGVCTSYQSVRCSMGEYQLDCAIPPSWVGLNIFFLYTFGPFLVNNIWL